MPVPWNALFPEGRHIFYEGNDPKGFAKEIKKRFGFDVTKDPSWGIRIPGGKGLDPFNSYAFDCPPGILDAVYTEYPMGS